MATREDTRRNRVARLTATVMSLGLLLAACGGDDSVDEAGAREALDGFIEGWAAASGTRSDAIRAQQTRRFLGGDLGAQVQGVRPGEGLERMYNEMMGAPFPPDNGHEVVGEPEVTEQEATFRVRLLYSGRAAGAMAAAGFISQAEVSDLQSQVADGLERTFVLRPNDEGDWQIHEIGD